MKPEVSLLHAEVPATCPYPEPDRSSPYPSISHFLKTHFNIIPHLHLGLPSGLFPSDIPTKTLYKPLLGPIRATWSAHIILLDLITRKTFGQDYRSLSSSVCSFLHSSRTSSLLCQNILLNTLFSVTLSLHTTLNLFDHIQQETL